MRLKVFLAALLLAFTCSLNAQQNALEQARAAREAGHITDAIALYRQVLASDANSREALRELVDLLDASGNWRDAVPELENLTRLEPHDVARLFQLGRMKSWQDGHRAEAVTLLQRACEESKNAEYCTQYASVLSWQAADRERAVSVLRSVVAAHAEYTPALKQLAEILSWKEETRLEAVRLFATAVIQEPRDGALWAQYAEVLSYQPTSRAQALSYYERALQLNPQLAPALTGKAQLLAWQGRSDEALALYEQALRQDPANANALRGKAEILNWRGQHEQAAALLQRAQKLAPEDSRIIAEVARTEIAQKQFAAARQTLAQVPYDADSRDLHGAVERALGPYLQMGYVTRRNRQHLDYQQLQTALSLPLGVSQRLTFAYTPALYNASGSNFNGTSYGLRLDSTLSERATLSTQLGVDTYPGISPAIDGGFDFRYRVGSAVELQGGFARANVDDSPLSMRGTDSNGTEIGQVRSNLATAGVSYENKRHGYDFWATYTDGVYTARGFDPNRRWGADGQFGKTLRGSVPYLRLAYGVSYAQFGYNAEAALEPSQGGGYFSPHRFLLNYGSLSATHRVGKHLEFEVSGTLGAQNVSATDGTLGAAQLASSVRSRLLWRLTERDELQLGYDFLNVYNAFHRHLPSISWRHYF